MKNSNNNTDNKAIDKKFLRSIVENDIEFEKELFSIFSENAQRNLLKLEEAIKSADNNSWYMAAHAFKGSSASIGAFELSKVLEYAQKNPEESTEKKIEVLDKVKDKFAQVLKFISEEISDN